MLQSHISIRLLALPGVGNDRLIDWWQYPSVPKQLIVSGAQPEHPVIVCVHVAHVWMCLCNSHSALAYLKLQKTNVIRPLYVTHISVAFRQKARVCSRISRIRFNKKIKTKQQYGQQSKWLMQTYAAVQTYSDKHTHIGCDSKHSLNPLEDYKSTYRSAWWCQLQIPLWSRCPFTLLHFAYFTTPPLKKKKIN